MAESNGNYNNAVNFSIVLYSLSHRSSPVLKNNPTKQKKVRASEEAPTAW